MGRVEIKEVFKNLLQSSEVRYLGIDLLACPSEAIQRYYGKNPEKLTEGRVSF